MNRSRARTIAAPIVILLIGGLTAFVGLNVGAPSGPDQPNAERRTGTRTDDGGRAQRASRPALVERMIVGLKQGRRVRSPDNPVTGTTVPTVQVAENVPVGRLRIPAMDLETTFYEGVHDAVINSGPGHWPGTPLPGQAGNAVLSGHRVTHGAEFEQLDMLRRGDRIQVWVGGAERPTTYAVRDTAIVRQSRYVPYVLRQPVARDASQLTLFACDPVYDHTHRIVVRAEATPVAPAKAG